MDESRGFDAFGPVFSSGPSGDDGPGWYLVLLHLGEDAAPAVGVVAECLARADTARDQVAALLGSERGWRDHLVGCVGVLAQDAAERSLDALLAAAGGAFRSWVSPQILSTASLVGPTDWAERVQESILDRSDPKAAAALVALAVSASDRTSELALTDREGGGEIAARWKANVAKAFDGAGLHRDW